MRRVTVFAMAAALVGGTAVLAVGADQVHRDNRVAAQGQVQLPDGFQMKELHQIDNIRGELIKTVDVAMTPKDFGRLVGQLWVVNRDRMKDFKNQDFSALNGVINQIRQDWKTKYGHDFDIKRADNVIGDQYTIVQGVVTAANVAANTFPVAPEFGAQLASSKERSRERERERLEGQADQVSAKDLQESKGVAIVMFPSFGEALPEVTASMIEEGHGSWYVALPASMSSQQLHTQLQNELTYLGQNVNKWPANETEAYRNVAHRVLLALYNVNAPEAGKAEHHHR